MSTLVAANIQNTGSGAPTFKNSSGTEIGQIAKAWVNFNGKNTPAIRDSFNVSSLTDLSFANYEVNFSNDFANANYCTVSQARADSDGGGRLISGKGTPTVAKYHLQTVNTGNNHEEVEEVNAAFFGD
jgi:hypothetical protein